MMEKKIEATIVYWLCSRARGLYTIGYIFGSLGYVGIMENGNYYNLIGYILGLY